MGAQTVDYRVSRLVVLCKDCGNDVGLYPARHKCQPVDRPAMPALPSQYVSTTSVSRSPSTSPSSSGLSSRLVYNANKTTADVDEEDTSVYLNNFTANLPEQQQESNGKKLWGKVRQNEKWKQLTEKNDKGNKQTGKLWGKLLQATQNMADKIPSRDDRGPESDEDDWEGETHVSRILREYYERKQQPLPHWLMDNDAPITRRRQSNRLYAEHDDQRHLEIPTSSKNDIGRSSSRRRLWDQDAGDDSSPKNLSSRERERQELRQQALQDSQPVIHQRRPIADNYDTDVQAYNNRGGSNSGNRRDYRHIDNLETRNYQHNSRSEKYYSNGRYNNDETTDHYAANNGRGHHDREDAFAGDNRKQLQQRSKSTMDSSSRLRYHEERQQQLPTSRSGRSVRGYNSNGPLPRSNNPDVVRSHYSSASVNDGYERPHYPRRPSIGDSNRSRRYAAPEPGYF